MSNNRDSVMSQVRLIQLQVFAAIEEANAGVAPERRVTPKSALTVVKRSLNSTRDLPFEVREFHAMRELSAFISLVQKNNLSDTFTNHTDLLTSAHPSSTRTHGLSASALSKAQLRWILSDSRISEEARPLLASMFTSPKTSAEYKYAEVRLSTLPRGSYPLEALTAAFGDGNSFIARRARALLQKRDRKGRFAYQGGGASALVERENGQVERLTGRVVSQSETGDTVRIQLPNGRLVDIPTDGAEFIKAVIGKNNDGFSGTKAKYKAGDIILNEEDLEFFEAPHGFRKDEAYAGPGTKYTDDEYDVVREANSFKISRREDGKSVGSAKNWADAQKAIFDDEPVADAEAGREPIARLSQEQIDRMYDDPNFDPKDILTPEGAAFDESAGQDETPVAGEFKYNYPEGAYQLPLDVKYADGFADPANDSDDFTDDPKELAQKFSSEALVNALRKGLLPGDSSKASGEGVLQFKSKEPLPVEALYLALEEKGENAKLEVAKIYDAANGNKKNQEALARLEGAPAPEAKATPKAVIPAKTEKLDSAKEPLDTNIEAQPEPEKIGEPNAERAARLNTRADELAATGDISGAAVYRLRAHRDGEAVRLYSSAGEGNVSLPVGNVETANSFTPSAEATRIMQEGGITPLTMHELKASPENAAIFHQAINDAKNANEFGASVFVYSPEEYADMRMFLSPDGKSGFALKGNDLVSVFKGDTQDKRVAHAMVPLAIQEGAVTGDAFDTVLPKIYGDHGLKTVARLPWDDSQAPSDWDKKTFSESNNGEPDVAFMAYDPDDTAGYIVGQGKMFSDYGDAVQAQQDALVKPTQDASGIENEPSNPPAEPMRRGQVSPGGDWQWYPPVRMGGNQQAKGFWGRTEKGIAKLPPKEAKAPSAPREPVLPDEIGGDWVPGNDLDYVGKGPVYDKTIDGVNYRFVQNSDGTWDVFEMRGGERYSVGGPNQVDIADPAVFDDKIAQIVDAKQKLNRTALKELLMNQGFNREVINSIDEANASEILAAVTADPAYADLQAKHERFMQGEQNAPFRAESKAFLDINSNLDKIRDNYEQPDVADAVTDVRGGIPTSSEIQRMLDGEGIGSQDEISGDAPSEVLPKAAKVVSGEKQEQDPEKRNAILDQLNGFAERANKALDLVEQLEPADEGMDTNRIRSAGESVNLAEDTLAEAMVNVDDASILDNDIQQAVFYLTEAINTLADVKSPEAPGVRSEILELRDELEAYRGSLESKPEVSPKDLKKEEKAVNVPDGIQKVVDELDAMEKALKDNLNELPLFQEEQNRLISAQLALFVARDTLNKAILNLNSRVDFVRLMDEAIGIIGSAVESLTSDELRMPEILEIKDSLKKLQQQFADAKFKHLKSIPKDKTPIDDVVKNMLLGGELEVAVEDLVPNNEYTDVSPEAYAALKEKLKSAGFYGIQINDFNFVLEELFRQDIEVYYDRDGDPEMRRRVATIISDGGPEALGIDWPTEELFNEFSEELRDAVENINLKEETPEVPAEAPVEAPATGRGRRVRNNNVAANRRWQARFGIKPPVFYKKNRGMFYDINGVPVNVGDKVTHNNPDKDEKYGEGVIISRIPNLGRWREARGEQVKVDYASYVWVQFANGKKAKLATRMLINKNPESVENPANVVKPVLDAEMPPPDVFIDDWKKFGKALAEFGVEPGKDARGNEGFQADAGNAQQMVISKDADGNYAVYLKEENIWRNRQVEPLFVTKSLPEAANYFIAEVHNRRYQTDFPANPVWAGDKAPTAVANPETNVVDVPEAGSVNNAGMPNAVNLNTDVDFEDLQKQIQDAIDNGQKIVFNYKGEDRLVTPKRIWTNPKNGNINLDAVGEDGFKVYTISNMENPNNPVEATPIPEVVIPEDVAPETENNPSLEAAPLEEQMANARAELARKNEAILDKNLEGATPEELKALEDERNAFIKKIKDMKAQIDKQNAAPSEDPMIRLYELKEEYKNLNEEILDLEIAPNPDRKAIAEKKNRQEELLEQMIPLRAEVNKVVAPVASEPEPDNQGPDAARAKQLEAIIAEFNETPENAQQDFEIINNDGKSVTIFDSRNGRQFEISWDENANIWASNPMGFERNVDRKFSPSLNEAVDTAVTDLSNERENVDKFKDFKEYAEGLMNEPEFQKDYDMNTFGGEGILRIQDKKSKNQSNIKWDEDAQGYRVTTRLLIVKKNQRSNLGEEQVFADIEEAGQYALDTLDEARNGQAPEGDENPSAIKKDETPVGGGDAFDKLDDGNSIADLLGELGAKLPKFRNTRGEKNARWARRYIDEAAAEFRTRPIDKAGISELNQALSYAVRIPGTELRDSVVSEIKRLQENLAAKREVIKQGRIVELNKKYENPLPKGLVPTDPAELSVENALAIAKEFQDRLPEKDNYDIDKFGDKAAMYLRYAIEKLESLEGDEKFDRVNISQYLQGAVGYLQDGNFNDNQKVLASDLLKFKELYEQKRELDKIEANQKMYDNLALPIDDANWPTESNLDKEKAIIALDELLERLPDMNDYEADDNIRAAASRIRSYKNSLVHDDKELDQADRAYLESAVRYLRLEAIPNPIQINFSNKIENLLSIIDSKREEIRNKRLEEYKKNLAAPFPDGVIPENGDGVNKDQLIALFDELNKRLPAPENRDFNYDMRRAGEYARYAQAEAQGIPAGNPDPFIRKFDSTYLENIINKLTEYGDEDEKALIPQLEKAKKALVDKKNSLNTDIRNKYLARRDVPIPKDALPDEEKEGKQDFIDAVNQVFNRLPVDTDEEANTSVISAREILEKYINQLNSNDDPFAANTRYLKEAADYLVGNSSDEKYAEFADFLNEIADYALGRRLERPVPALAPANMDAINPAELAIKRIEAGENPYTSPEGFKELFADEGIFNNNSYLKPFQEQIQKFFDGNEHALSELDIRARQAMSQWVASQLHNPPKVMDDTAIENVHNLVSLMAKLDDEKAVYEPNRNGLGVGSDLLKYVPDDFFAVAKRIGPDQEIVIDGVSTGFKARQLQTGINSQNNFIVTHIATGQRFIFKKEGSADQARGEKEVAFISSGLGIHSRIYTENHPLDKRAIVQTFAGDTVRKNGDAVNFNSIRSVSEGEPAKELHIRNTILMHILDALISNSDRNSGNFMVAAADNLGVDDNGYHNIYLIPIDHGYAAAINGQKAGSLSGAKRFLLSPGSAGGQIAAEVAKNIGTTAFKDILDMSLQQLEQYLNRLDGGEISQQTLATITARMAELKGINPDVIEIWLGRK